MAGSPEGREILWNVTAPLGAILTSTSVEIFSPAGIGGFFQAD
jgi:hypothetical protein